MPKNFFCLALLLISMSVTAAESPQDPAAYERLLLPVYDAEGRPGAFGSLWKTELVIANEGAQPVTVFHSQCVFFCTCVSIACGRGQALQPGEAFRGESLSPVPPAAFVHAERALVDTLSMNLRVFDAAHGNLTFGTEVPIVRERDLRTATTWLINVPVDARFRAYLRILGVASASGEGQVRVRVSSMSGGDVLLDQVLEFQAPLLKAPGRIPRPADTNAEQPAFAEIGPMQSVLGTSAPARVRIRIDSLNPELQYWPYVAVISNETQHVTLITPQ